MNTEKIPTLLNKENVSQIVMRPTAITKCKIGQDWFKSDFECLFTPGDYYPDYMEVDKFIMDIIDGQELNIEEAARLLYDFLMEYQPKSQPSPLSEILSLYDISTPFLLSSKLNSENFLN